MSGLNLLPCFDWDELARQAFHLPILVGGVPWWDSFRISEKPMSPLPYHHLVLQ